MMTRTFLYLVFGLLTACGSSSSPTPSTTTSNNGPPNPPVPAGTALLPQVTPIEVSVRGYNGDLMEPFISPDGQTLLFNNLNDPAINTELHWARRVSDELFDYQGLVSGVATSSLEGVPSLDQQGNLYFISPRSYPQTLSTVHRAQFVAGTGTGVELVSGLATAAPGRVIFDADVNRDGQQLVLSEGLLTGGPVPQTADLRSARRSGGGFVFDTVNFFTAVNRPDALEYAGALSADGLLLYFTRKETGGPPTLFRARRARTDAAFGPPERINGLQDIVEAATFSGDQSKIYYHARVGAGFRLFYFSH